MNRPTLAAAAAMLALSGCAKTLEAPSEAGVCYLLATPKNAPAKFNQIADHVADIEHCAAQIDLVRKNFGRLGSAKQDYVGAFQGAFVFVDNDGVTTANKLTGTRYPLLTNFHGELIAPGAIVEGKAPPGTNELK
jgi:hypothetical protein